MVSNEDWNELIAISGKFSGLSEEQIQKNIEGDSPDTPRTTRDTGASRFQDSDRYEIESATTGEEKAELDEIAATLQEGLAEAEQIKGEPIPAQSDDLGKIR